MLYDILSPLIFFASLGGILLIVGRVVIRIRREQLSTNIRSVAAQAPSVHSTLWQPVSKEVTQLLQPTQKSVHAMRSRFAQVAQMVHQTKDTLGTWRTRRREAKAAVQAARATTPPPQLVAAAAATPENVLQAPATAITAPSRRGLRGRLALLKLRRRQSIVAPLADQEEILPVAATDPTLPPVPSVTPTTPSEITPPPPVAVEAQSKTPVTLPDADSSAAVSVSTSPIVAAGTPPPNFASSLLRRVQGRGRQQPEALRTAEVELENHDFQAAEDRLVPYIVKHPKDTTAYMLLGQAAMGRKAWEEAMEIFEQVVKWNRKQTGAYANLGLAAYQAGRFTKALQALQRSLDTDPNNREVLGVLLSIAEKMDNPALQHSIREKIEVVDAHAKQQKNVPQNASV